jgi:predicted homoserine dehydrogenase-like protein
VAAVKRDLRAGRRLDGVGGYDTYGLAENAGPVARDRLLPMGVVEGCTLVRDVPRDAVLTYDDVDVPRERVVDQLRREQALRFGTGAPG